jgi:hypothetical protein
MTAAGVPGALAQSATARHPVNSNAGNYAPGNSDENVAQEIGARTRAEISRLSARGADVDRALKLQAEGDQELRDGDPVLAAEFYGRAREAVSVLEGERLRAADARAETHRDLEQAQRSGNVDLARAENFNQKGDDAFNRGDYTDAQVYYAIARAHAVTRTASNR